MNPITFECPHCHELHDGDESMSTPQLELSGVSRPFDVKEPPRTHYRAARQREGVRPTEFIDT
jgi:hypothetical protein